jgi:hypothetical protein
VNTIALHQAIHGYTDGHRALGSSIELGAKDAKTLLVFSDISGPGSRLKSSGYLSGYPLAQSGLYALARTWPAPEMPRPGCVWTHTLLIDFADLATLTDLSQLNSLFRRPENPSSKFYRGKIIFDTNRELEALSDEVIAIAKPLIKTLYKYPSKPVISFEADCETSERSVLALWTQQWPRLRRSFRFCTLATSDRSTKDSPFDLQLLPASMPSLKSRFVDAIEADTNDSDPDWMPIVVNDLRNPQDHALRQFLFRAGSDLQNGRSSFANLCQIFSFLEGSNENQLDLKIVLELLPDSSNINSARAVKSIIIRRIFKQHFPISRTVLSFVVNHLDLLDRGDFGDDTTAFGMSLLKSQPELFLKMGRNGEIGEHIVRQTLEVAPISSIVTAASRNSDILPIAIKHRIGLFESSEAWSLIEENDDKALDQILHEKSSPIVLIAALETKRFELAASILKRVDQNHLMQALHRAYAERKLTGETLRRWLDEVATVSALSQLFITTDGIERGFLHVVSELYEPDALPGGTKSDPWFEAIKNATSTLDEADELSLRSYVLTRGLSDHTKNAAELAEFGFEITDRALATNRLSYSDWSQLERKLPWSIFWPEWDKCRRLRKGLMERFVDDHWSAEVFINLTTDDDLFAELVVLANDSYRGRQYLKAVNDALKQSNEPRVGIRRAIIKHILNG